MAEEQNIFDGLSETMKAEMEKMFADKIASSALNLINKDDMEKYAKQMFYSLQWNNEKTRYWSSESDQLQTIVFNKFREKVGKELSRIVEDGLFDEEAKETASRIYKEALETAEKYMVEALANRMCSITTDFDNIHHKIDMNQFVNQVMNDHMTKNHIPR